jgi:hypothetical protein
VNVALRSLVPDDAAWLDAWLPVVASRVGYDATDAAALLERARRERSLRLRIIEREGTPAGIAVYHLNTPKRGAALFELIATPAEHARHGAGMTAAALAEDDMRATGVRVAYAPAPAIHGISLYFWIRLGYAPLLRPEWPCARVGVAWLRRWL